MDTEAPPATPAFLEGKRAGDLLLAPSLNPFPETDARHLEWNRGRLTSLDAAARYANAAIARDRLRGYPAGTDTRDLNGGYGCGGRR